MEFDFNIKKIKRTLFNIVRYAFFAVAGITALFCIFDVIKGGLFAASADIKGGIGLALVVVAGMAAQIFFEARVGMGLRKKDKRALSFNFYLIPLSLLLLILSLIGHYNVLPALFGLILPLLLVYTLR